MACQHPYQNSRPNQHIRTFLVIVLLQPVCAKQRLGQPVVPFLDDQRLASLDNVEQHKLFELALSYVANLSSRDALHPVEIGRPIDERMEVEIWRDGVELRLRMHRCRHLCGDVLGTSWAKCQEAKIMANQQSMC